METNDFMRDILEDYYRFIFLDSFPTSSLSFANFVFANATNHTQTH